VAFLKYVFPVMGGYSELHIHADNEQAVQRAVQACVAEARRIEAKYSRYRTDSALSKINSHAGGASTPIDAETAALLAYAQACYEASDGLFDVTSGVLRKAWDFNAQGSAAKLPQADKLESLLAHVGWHRVVWQQDSIQLPIGMELDFGGIGKEYAADRLASVLLGLDIHHAMVNMAGDIRVVGPQAVVGCDWYHGQAMETEPWHIGIVHPRHTGQTCHSLAIQQGALATSGDYERFIEIDGRRYCHILHPQTGLPVSEWQAVSVVAPLCVVAGSACTIAMLKGAKAIDFLQTQDVDYLVWGEKICHRRGVFD
jgi:FAD:protein FMN transferase